MVGNRSDITNCVMRGAMSSVALAQCGCVRRAERGAWWHVGGWLGGDGLPTAGAITLVQVVPCRPRPDWRDLDVVVGVREHLTFERYLPAARAALGKEVAGHIRVRTELAGHPRTALAALLLARLVRDIALLTA